MSTVETTVAPGHTLPQAVADAQAALIVAKDAGNEALKSADMPRAMELYEEALRRFDEALAAMPQEKVLRNNDVVHYGEGRFAIVDTAFPQFGDYVLEDLGTQDIVKQKVGKYDEVQRRFLRKELSPVPPDLFELRLACLNNLTLVALKMARGSQQEGDFKETVRRANAALAMDGRSAKALMRKGSALMELRQIEQASQVLMLAAQETGGRDAEVMRLLEQVVTAKGKGRGKGKNKFKRDRIEEQFSHCASCGMVGCRDPDCRARQVSDSEESATEDPKAAPSGASFRGEHCRQEDAQIDAMQEDGGHERHADRQTRLQAPSSVPDRASGAAPMQQHRTNGIENRHMEEPEQVSQVATKARRTFYMVPVIVVLMVAVVIVGITLVPQYSEPPQEVEL